MVKPGAQASEEVRAALEADMDLLRCQLDEASEGNQQMNALEADLARLQEQCQQLQTTKSEAETDFEVCAACWPLTIWHLAPPQ